MSHVAMAAPVAESHPGFIEEIDYEEMEIRDPVGKGSFGVVYMAIWKNSSVAVKMIESESERIAFMTELRQLSRVNHPNIIRLYGACRNPVSLVMEFAECGSLYNLLHGQGNQPHYNSGHAMSWCLQCANGVAYLHGMKPKALIHRDLKPPNLLLTNNGMVLKICDFGTACDQHTHMTNNKGSAAWMAPEVFEGCQYSEKCDVFSWGIIIWEVLTRRKPFDDLGGPAFRIMWAVHTGARPPLIQGCPPPVEELMSRCWSSKPHERPSMDEVVDAMIDLLTLFPGGQNPLMFSSHEESSSGTNSSYDYSLTADSMRESHMSTISDTVRKPRTVHPSVTSLTKSHLGSSSPSLARTPEVFEPRTRSRSHTPDPQRGTPEPTPLNDAGKRGVRRSSADLINELENCPIERTPIGSRPASPSPGRQPNKRLSTPSPISIAVPGNPQTPPGITTPTNPVMGAFGHQAPYTGQNTAVDSNSCDSLPRAYITLELHLQPLPPTTSSKESMEIYEKHCRLAEEYLRVQTEISLVKHRREQLTNELEQDKNLQGNRLAIEYQQLVAENTSLQKWYDKMKKDLTRVRENQH